ELYDFASTQLAQTIARDRRVGDVDVGGSSLPAVTLTSDTYSQGELYDFASTQLAQTIARDRRVGDVDVGGSSLPAV
ncbi:hypothetical protein EVV80_28670, partial [Klebsiella pneumoniae]